MEIQTEIIKDSINNGNRITTFIISAPKFLDAEFEKHGLLNINSSSDRAIPFFEMVNRPIYLPKDLRMNQSGMQGYERISSSSVKDIHRELQDIYEYIRAKLMYLNTTYNLHKQHLNRYLMPFSYQTKIITATCWNNFFTLRMRQDADPNIINIATRMYRQYINNEPKELKNKQWHLPLVIDEEIKKYNVDTCIKISVARCARVSYDKSFMFKPINDDLHLFNKLIDNGHWSCMQHQAKPVSTWQRLTPWLKRRTDSNLKGWIMYRKTFKVHDYENV